MIKKTKNPKKVLFVEPRGNDQNVFSKYLTLPLMGPIYLATILKKRGHKVRVVNERILGRDINIADLRADFLCISIITSTANRGYELARQFKAQNPDGKVIIGGIHASMMPDEAKQFADHLVIGEGESVIIDLIEKPQKTKQVTRTQHINMEDYPIPDFNTLINHKKMYMTPVITSRGCPFDCNFCSVTEMFGKKYRTISINKTMTTLRSADPKKVFFYDDNFAALKTRTRELVQRIKRSSLDFKWTCQVRTDVTNDPKLVEQMADSGCYNVYVGFESVNPKTLKAFNKAQGVEHIKKSIKIFHDNSINVHGMFIFGSDEDDKRVFSRTSEFCNAHEIDSTQFGILTPLPGTVVYKNMEAQGRLLHKNWEYYDALHTVFKPKLMTALELQEGMIDAFKDFYSYSRAVNEALNTVGDYGTSAIRSIYSKVRAPSFARAGFRLIGAKIVKDWVSQNSEYLEFLTKMELRKQALSKFY